MYLSTPLVAQDMLTYAQVEQKAAGKPVEDAKLWYFGQSYVTILGTTFASLFPHNVSRLILDGVVDAEDYYRNGWRTDLYQTDEAINSFAVSCHQHGQTNCSFWGPSADDIKYQLDNILAEIKTHPIPKTGLCGQNTPGLATYSDLKQLKLLAPYLPLEGFSLLAGIMTSIESQNSSLFMEVSGFVRGVLDSADADVMIKCIDAYGVVGAYNYSTIENYRDYINLQVDQSKYEGEAWPVNADGVLCRSSDVKIPMSISFQGISHLPLS
jgi:hypothetical protein